MSETGYTTRYVCRTAIGKPLYIMAKQKAINTVGGTVSSYELTEDFIEASKCVNKVTARTLIKDYKSATQSTKTFEIYRVSTTYKLEDKIDE